MLQFLIQRPIGAIMSTIAIVVVSLVFVRDIPVALLPDIPIPNITVQISAPQLDSRTLESTVVRSIRQQLMQVNDLKDISSRTRNGSAIIELQLDFGVNTDLSSIEINEKMDQIMHLLPDELERPRVIKSNISDIPVFYVDIFPRDNEQFSDVDFSNFIKRTVRKRLEQIPQIAFVDMHGFAEAEVVVIPNREIMTAFNIDDQQLRSAIVNANIQLGNIILKDGAYQYNVELSSKLVNKSDIEELFVNINDRVYQLKDIATVYNSQKQRRGAFYFDRHEGISLAVRRKSDANNYELRSAIDTLFKDLALQHPEIEFHLSNDQSNILEVSIENLRTSLLYGLGFAAIIMFVFFRDWRLPLLIIISIPLGLVLTLFGFYLFDISINIISLAGLILGVGLMIDNAIIIIENIKQKNHEMELSLACSEGTNEVIRPLVSSALTTSSVFLPMILLSGLAGVLFYDQAISIALALTCSILVSYFILPVFANLMLNSNRPGGKSIVHRGHAHLIKWLLRYRSILIPIFLLLGFGCFFPFRSIQKSAFPEMTRMDYTLSIDWNEQLSLEENNDRYLHLKDHIAPWIQKATCYLGELQFFLVEEPQHMNESEVILSLNDASDIVHIRENIESLFHRLYPDASYGIVPLSNVFDRIFNQDKYDLFAHLQSTSQVNFPKFEEVETLFSALQSNYDEIKVPPLDRYLGIRINQENLIRYNIDYNMLINRLKFLLRNNEVSQLRGNDEFIPIQISNSLEMNDIGSLMESAQVLNRDRMMIPIQAFVDLAVFQDYKDITSIRSGECLTIPFDKYDEEVVNGIREVVKDHPEYSVQFSGAYFSQLALQNEMKLVGGVVFLLLFLILAAQFESFIQPFIVALTLPVGILGALLALHLTGQSLNIVAIIGIIIMSGIDVNDAILKIDIINNNIKSGMSLNQAIIDGSERRIRPILMTSVTTILAMIPILFSTGLGAELQRPLAVAVIGGLIFGTMASIVMVPMLYRFFYRGESA